MLVVVDPRASEPLVDQIANQIRGAIARGDLVPRERLASARDLGASLGVNLHTVLRAYGRLRDEGLIELRRGRGAMVSADARAEDVSLRELARELVRRAHLVGLNTSDVIKLVEE